MEPYTMQSNVKILAVNISTEISNKLLENFMDNHYTITMIDNLFTESASKMIDNYQIVIVQLDTNKYTTETLSSFCQSNPLIEVIGIINNGQTDTHLYLQAGMFDTVASDCSYDELTSVILKAEKHQKKNSELTILKQFVAMNYGFDNLVGDSKPMKQLKEKIIKVSPTDIAVMISGQTGTGKSLTAQIIHHHSERRKQPFITFDPSSTPEVMHEEILFGNTLSNKTGLLHDADTGTLFLKDVHLIPQSLQQKLITFLHTNSIEQAGNSKKLSIRFISSTSQSMNSMVQNGTFEKELYHMLCEVSLVMPQLKERLNDIEMLAEYFVRRVSFETNRPIYTFSREALELLYNHYWSENVSELENTIKRAVSLCRSSQIEENDILFIESSNRNSTSNRFTVDMSSEQSNGILDEGQRSLIIKTLNENDWNYSQTAVELGIGRTTLWRKVKKYNLKKETSELVG